MADLSDVEEAIVISVTNALYPNGTSQDSIIGNTCRVYRGWPSPSGLNSDLAAGVVNVTVFPAMTPDEIPPAYLDSVYSIGPAVTLVGTVAGQSVAFSGSVSTDQLVGLLVDGAPFIYRPVAGDTDESIAANLQVLISGQRPALAQGATITVPGAMLLRCRIVSSGTVFHALRRQRREVQISCWCPSTVARDIVSKAVDLTLTAASFLTLTDSTMAHISYVATQVYDQSLNALLYRRDLCYKCEFVMTSMTSAPEMLFGTLVRNGTTQFV